MRLKKKIPIEEYKNIVDKIPIVCVDGIIINKKKEFLLIKRKNPPLKNKWWIPGGRIYKGETLEKGFIRKMKEELGINVKIILSLGYYEEHFTDNPFDLNSGVHTISIVFLALYRKGKIRVDNQSYSWKWSKKLPSELLKIKPFNVFK